MDKNIYLDCSSFLIAEPTVEPFVQVHEAILVQFHPAIGFEELIKFRHRLALRLAEDRFINRLAVLFVPDDDACFPSSVRSVSDHSVPVRTSFTYVFHLLSRTTIPQRFLYIQRKSKELSESYQFASMFFLCFPHQKICDSEFISAIRLRCQEKRSR